MDMKVRGSKELLEEVIGSGLCVYCGACSGGCPYLVPYKGRVVLLHNCALSQGQCYQYCPQTYTDMDELSQQIFGVPYGQDEIGVVRETLLARSTNAEIREKGQDGGVVTTLLSLALDEGLIDCAVTSRMSADKTPGGFLARNQEELLKCSTTSYEASPVLEAYNRIPKQSTEKLGVVGLPCQVRALAKMKAYPPENRVNVNNIKLVVGVFCGWALLPAEFHQFLTENYDLSQVVKFDIPHHPEHTFDVYTKSGKKSIEIDEVRKFINPACSYCLDMVAEFADISVGSGRHKYKGWNTVIVRTKTGAKLMELAKAKAALDYQPLPDENLINLKQAALRKKKRALASIVAKTGSKKNLLYLGVSPALVNKLLT